jgi:L-fuconolactonase
MFEEAIVDSHVHLCDPDRLRYSWRERRPALAQPRLPSDFRAAVGGMRIDAYIFVEIDVLPPQHLDEADWVAELAQSDTALRGMIASAPIELGAAVEADLDRLRRHRLLKGIRRVLEGRDSDFFTSADLLAGLKLLARHDLPFDISIFHHQLPGAIQMVRRCPDVRFVLDHIGKPAVSARQLDPWRARLKELAAFPNVHCKISGLITEAGDDAWTQETLSPYIGHAIESFGFDRLMFGSDWHVVELTAPYAAWVEVVARVVGGCTAAERRKLFRENATRFYRLDG